LGLQLAAVNSIKDITFDSPKKLKTHIMAEVIRMPLLSDTMKEGVIAEWHKKVGDTVKSDDVIAEVETDKATMEVMPYVDGTLLYIGVEKGKGVPVNGIMAIIGKPGEDFQSLLDAEKGGSGAAPGPTTATGCTCCSTAGSALHRHLSHSRLQPAAATSTNSGSSHRSQPSHKTSDDRVKASPLAKKLADRRKG
jgi:pyruvate/2-oxoglutarate dehydrogenase complex dihydrolipoamide acyltransferase (E2) component